jgi:hypothetical protein
VVAIVVAAFVVFAIVVLAVVMWPGTEDRVRRSRAAAPAVVTPTVPAPVTVTLTASDVRALGVVVRRRSTGTWLASVALLVGLVGVMIDGVLSGHGSEIVIGGALIALLIVVDVLSRRAARKVTRATATAASGILTPSEEGLRAHTPQSDQAVDWAYFVGVAEDGLRAFLLTDRRSGFIIPKRAFDDTASFRNFVAFAAGRIEEAHRDVTRAHPTGEPRSLI